MSERNKKFEELIQALASGKATWDRLEQELSAAADLTASQKEDVRTAAQCRRIEQLKRDPVNDEKKLAGRTIPISLADGGDGQFHRQILREATLGRSDSRGAAGQRALGLSLMTSETLSASMSTCDPRDGAESALARLIPMLLHATTGCLERSETLESQEVRHSN